jgi:predicted small secreted protein
MRNITATIKRAILVAALLGVVSTFLACNTTRGVGRDVERAGEAIQDATK